MAIGNDTSGITTAINNFITAYNSLRTFVTAQQQVATDGTVDSTSAPLFGDTILRSITNSIGGILGSSYGSSGVNSLGAIGITFDSSNNLQISDPTALNNALTNNLSGVQTLFATQYTSTDSNLTIQSNTSSLGGPFTLDVQTDGSGNITGASVGSDSSSFSVSGNLIIGKPGTIYAGLTFQYTGATSSNVTVSFPQGLADSLYNSLDSYANSNTGVIINQVNSLQTTDTQLQQRSADIKADGETYRQQLIQKYADMETKISAAQTLKSQIIAILNGSDNNGN